MEPTDVMKLAAEAAQENAQTYDQTILAERARVRKKA